MNQQTLNILDGMWKIANSRFDECKTATDLTLQYHAQYLKALQTNKAASNEYEKVRDHAFFLIGQVQADPNAGPNSGWIPKIKAYLDGAVNAIGTVLPGMKAAVIADMAGHIQITAPGGADPKASPIDAATKIDDAAKAKGGAGPAQQAPSGQIPPPQQPPPETQAGAGGGASPWVVGGVLLGAALIVWRVVRGGI